MSSGFIFYIFFYSADELARPMGAVARPGHSFQTLENDALLIAHLTTSFSLFDCLHYNSRTTIIIFYLFGVSLNRFHCKAWWQMVNDTPWFVSQQMG